MSFTPPVYQEDLSSCVSSINLQVYVPQVVMIADTDNAVFAEVVLWSAGYLLASRKSEHRAQLRSVLEEKAKQLVIAWTAAQR
jgi:hypothetical protein